jgi:hypothetical protein
MLMILQQVVCVRYLTVSPCNMLQASVITHGSSARVSCEPPALFTHTGESGGVLTHVFKSPESEGNGESIRDVSTFETHH